MFAVDYPMASARTGADWFRAVGLHRATNEKIAHVHAENYSKPGSSGGHVYLPVCSRRIQFAKRAPPYHRGFIRIYMKLRKS